MNRHQTTFILRAVAVVLLTAGHLQAQSVATPSNASAGGMSDDELLRTILFWMVVIGMFKIVAVSLGYTIYALNTIKQHLDGTLGQRKEPSFGFTQAVPIEREHEIMLDHNYDGIQELDNKLPPWWVAMFYLTIVFGVVYIWYYHFRTGGQLQEQEYQTELVEAEAQQKLMANRVDENSVKLLTESDKIAAGQAIFAKNCVACHGKLGEGGVGPNLTDSYWLHGGDIKSVFKTIKYGVPAKGMIPWQAQLSPSQIQEVASFIATLKNTNPPNAKEPQGEEIIDN